jgi:hypothetical protein
MTYNEDVKSLLQETRQKGGTQYAAASIKKIIPVRQKVCIKKYTIFGILLEAFSKGIFC